MQAVVSALYVGQVFAAMGVVGVAFAPFAVFSADAARAACRAWAGYALWSLGWMTGLRSEVRGAVPRGEVLVCAKHQSFLDIIVLFRALPRAKFIMKRGLLFVPFIGLYAWRLGCVPVRRGRRGAAIRQMLADVQAGRARPGQLVIYPQGTRIAPGVAAPYKAGAAALYDQLGQPCVPAATNAGVFWPRRGMTKRPGLAVVEFLPPVAPGLPADTFMARLEREVEAAAERLRAEATAD